MRRLVILALASVTALGLAACSGDDAEPNPTAPTGATAATGATGPTAATTGPTGTSATGPTGATAGTSPELEDGVHFGKITELDSDGEAMVFDLAYFYTGEEANQVAASRGDEVPVPNDVYVVNDNPKLRTLTVAPDAAVALIDWNDCCDASTIMGRKEFASVLSQGELVQIGDHLFYGTASSYWVTIDDGVVVLIEEQYFP
jgi:hypothetical protein